MPENYKSLHTNVTIYYTSPASIRDEKLLAEWRSWLDPIETTRLQRLQRPIHQHRFLISHALMRATLAQSGNCHPSEIEFGSLPQGKPIIDAPRTLGDVHFNLTHTHGMAAIAVTKTAPVGIDIEWLGRRGPEVDLAQRYFTENEYQDILSRPVQDQHRRLLHYWTLKEAYIKAEGWGLSVGLDSFEFELSADVPPTLHIRKTTATPRHPWKFHQFTLLDSHLVVLASAAPNEPQIICKPWPSS